MRQSPERTSGEPASTAFTVGWAFQFVGHVFEGKKPSFVEDRRNLVVGLVWWLKKSGVSIELDDGKKTSSYAAPYASAAE